MQKHAAGTGLGKFEVSWARASGVWTRLVFRSSVRRSLLEFHRAVIHTGLSRAEGHPYCQTVGKLCKGIHPRADSIHARRCFSPDAGKNELELGTPEGIQGVIDMQKLKRLASAFKTGLRMLSPNCREASRLQSEALGHPLSLPQRLGLRLHLLICKWCRRYAKQIRFLRQAVREHPDEVNDGPPQGLSREARERLKRSLHDESE